MLEKKKKSKSLKKKEKKKEKNREERLEKEKYDKYRCQAITKNGEQCERISDFIIDLRQGYNIKGVKVIPKIDCCLFCTQHLTLTLRDTSARLLLEGYMYLITKNLSSEEKIIFNIDKFYKEIENIEKTGNKWGIKI